MSFILAFDFGTHSIGVAVGNDVTKSATPLKAVKANYGQVNLDLFSPLFKEWCPKLIVVGFPYNMDGTTQDLSNMARKFGNRLAAKYQVQVHFQDERLTTAEAKEMLFADGGYKALKKGKIDCLSAALILESYFHQQQFQER